jgi:CHAT domain-containing protein
LFVLSPQSLHVETIPVNLERLAAQFFDRTQGRLLGIAHDNRPLQPMVRWESLAQHLFQPIANHLQDCTHIVLVPHGLLHLLPLPVLLSTLQPQITCSFAPSASIFYMLRTTSRDVPGLHNCLAVGFNQGGLLLSEWEAQHVALAMGGSWIVGTNATVAKVSAALPTSRTVHFSCHGFFNRQDPMRSGLILADGQLTALDILGQFELRAEIVTLAACDTALSELAYGDDPLGLTRAFIGAGARAILTTLWSIHEIPTTLFIEEFYRHWQRDGRAVGALSAAQRYLRELDVDDLRAKVAAWQVPDAVANAQIATFTARLPGRHPFDHPYYWGAFLLVGNPA